MREIPKRPSLLVAAALSLAAAPFATRDLPAQEPVAVESASGTYRPVRDPEARKTSRLLLDWSRGSYRVPLLARPDDSPIRVSPEGRAEVLVVTEGSAKAALDSLRALGFVPHRVSEDDSQVEGHVAPGSLAGLAALPEVRTVGLPHYGLSDAGSVASEGDSPMKTDQLRSTLGTRGAGISIGVVQLGFEGLAASKASGDLPQTIPTQVFRSDNSLTNGGAEGTAMLELIHDIAPEATLHAAAMSSSNDFIAAYNYLADRCQVVVDDISFFNLGPYDGSSTLSRALASVVARGVAAYGSTGNRARLHSAGTFDDSDGDGVHNFTATDEGLTLDVGNRAELRVFLQWQEPFGGASTDLDLLLYDSNTGQRLMDAVGGNDTQNGTQNPTEFLSWQNPDTATRRVNVRIARSGSTANRRFDLFFAGSITLQEYIVTAGSIPNKSDAGGGFVSVGAAEWKTPGTMESFSSRGPTADGRIKPEITGPDGTMTTVTGFKPFFGTSAAAPHVAAVAALLKSRKPTATPADLLAAMQATATDIGTPGIDNDSGAGFVNALAAAQRLGTSSAGCTESEPNEQPSQASPLGLPDSCTGSAASGDASVITISNQSGTVVDRIEDVFAVQLTAAARLDLTLTFPNASADLDLYLLRESGSTLTIIGASAGSGMTERVTTTSDLAPGRYLVGVSSFNGSSSYTLTSATVGGGGGTCTQTGTAICLNAGRFRVESTWRTPDGRTGTGSAVRLTADTGYFTFFDAANVEMVVKVLNGCFAPFNSYWVFAGGLTNVQVELVVTDTKNGTVKRYANPLDTAFQPIQDTSAFATCP